MTLTLNEVHQYTRIPGTLEVRLVKTSPYVRITHAGEPPVFIQGGQAYSEGGQRMDPMPAWLAGEVDKLSPTVRAEVGLEVDVPVPVDIRLRAPEAGPKPKPKPRPPAEMWTCPECQKQMAPRGRSFHELHHKKQAKKQQQMEVPDGDPNG